jgi:hypothetical protein
VSTQSRKIAPLDLGGAQAHQVRPAVLEQHVQPGRVAQVEAGQAATAQLDDAPLAVGRLGVGEIDAAQPRVLEDPAALGRARQVLLAVPVLHAAGV